MFVPFLISLCARRFIALSVFRKDINNNKCYLTFINYHPVRAHFQIHTLFLIMPKPLKTGIIIAILQMGKVTARLGDLSKITEQN